MGISASVDLHPVQAIRNNEHFHLLLPNAHFYKSHINNIRLFMLFRTQNERPFNAEYAPRTNQLEVIMYLILDANLKVLIRSYSFHSF